MSSQDDDGDWETDSEASPESDDIEPLDWDIFFDTKPAEWFRDSKGYTQYKDQDKGHIAGFQTAEAGVVLSSICKEIKRLQNHRELFPTEYVGEQFLGNVYDICGWVEEAFGFFQEELNMWHKLFDLELAEIKAASWPTFRAGRNPWHQFLHNGAPGHRVIPKQAPKTESMQIIPPGGLNLLQAWQTEIEDILKTYDEHLRIQRIPSKVVGDKRSYLAVTGNIRVMGTFADANGAPIIVPESSTFLRDFSTKSTMPLTQLSQDFEAFEDRVGHSNYGTNYVCVREGRVSPRK